MTPLLIDPTPSSEPLQCAFCGTPHARGIAMVFTETAAICEPCIGTAADIIATAKNHAPGRRKLPTPSAIKALLDHLVTGQHAAKTTLAVALYNHEKRLLLGPHGHRIQKSNILLIGPTGCGKSLLARALAAAAGVPLAIADATNLTARGYVGDDVESILLRLLDKAGGDTAAAEQGIVYIDEIDKIARKQRGPAAERDINGESVQYALLKILEGAAVTLPLAPGTQPPALPVTIDTTDILFICAGAFESIEAIVAARLRQPAIGFGAAINAGASPTTPLLSDITPADLAAYGMIPELVGRLPILATLEPLGEPELLEILTRPEEGIIGEFSRLLALDYTHLEFTEDALRAIAREALANGTGARGLRAILEQVLLPTMFTAPEKRHPRTVTIDAAAFAAARHARPKHQAAPAPISAAAD